MRPFATDRVAWSVCLTVCVRLLVTFVSPAKTAKPIEMPFGGLTYVGPRSHVFDGVKIPKGNGQFWGLVRPMGKHCQSLLRCTLQKGNNGITAPLM